MSEDQKPLEEWPDVRLAELLTAYCQTDYCVAAPEGSMIFHVGDLSPEQNLQLMQAGVFSWCIVTAWNPMSQQRSADNNDAALGDLKAEIESCDLKWWEAAGRDPSGKWPMEESCFVLNVSKEQTEKFCQMYSQVAALYGDTETEPWLLFADWERVSESVEAIVESELLSSDVSSRMQVVLEQNWGWKAKS